jgi:shikimate dehydrogenase
MTAQHAVFGQPISHSKSPFIHAAFGEAEGIALNYRAIEAGPDTFAQVLSDFVAAGGTGASVTLPLKEAAFALCSATSNRAARAGAVNTLMRRGDGWYGDNTDGVGLVRDLTSRQGLDLRGCRMLLLGAGGAARGVAPALMDAGIQQLVVSNRTAARADELVDLLGEPARAVSAYWEDLRGQGDFEVVINATSAGRGDSAPPVLPMSLVNSRTSAVDLNYGQSSVAFLAWAGSAGCRKTIDGLGMLVEQAAEAFALWHGRHPDTDAVYAQLRAQVDRLSGQE